MPAPDDAFNPWAGAAHLLAGTSRALEHRGEVHVGDGWKVARLLSPIPGRFAGLAFGEYPVTAVAVCDRESTHLPPVPSCECGFHAHTRREQAENLLDRARGLVLLHVEMYGNIVVHRSGIRAEEQEIHAMYLRRRCARVGCRRTSAGMTPARRGWVQVCREHLGAGLTVEELREALRIDVSVGEQP
jgi:hypothetical protein